MAFRRDCNDRTQALSRVDVAFFNHAIDDFGDCADRIAGQNPIGREAAIILNGYVFRTCEDFGDLATSELLPGTQNAGEYLQRHDGGVGDRQRHGGQDGAHERAVVELPLGDAGGLASVSVAGRPT